MQNNEINIAEVRKTYNELNKDNVRKDQDYALRTYKRISKKFANQYFFLENKSIRAFCYSFSVIYNLVSGVTEFNLFQSKTSSSPLSVLVCVLAVLFIELVSRFSTSKIFKDHAKKRPFKSYAVYFFVMISIMTFSTYQSFNGVFETVNTMSPPPQYQRPQTESISVLESKHDKEISRLVKAVLLHQKNFPKYVTQRKALEKEVRDQKIRKEREVSAARERNRITINRSQKKHEKIVTIHNATNNATGYFFGYFFIAFTIVYLFCMFFVEYYDKKAAAEFKILNNDVAPAKTKGSQEVTQRKPQRKKATVTKKENTEQRNTIGFTSNNFATAKSNDHSIEIQKCKGKIRAYKSKLKKGIGVRETNLQGIKKNEYQLQILMNKK